MWFKNIRIFQFKETIPYTPDDLAEQLQTLRFVRCGAYMPVSIGWDTPFEDDEAALVHASNGCMLISLKTEEKLIPSFVVRDHLEQRLKELEEKGQKISYREKKALKDDTYQELIPQAFSRISQINAYIDCKNHWLVIDSSSHTKMDLLTSYLRKSLHSLPIEPLEFSSPSILCSHWLQTGTPPNNFMIDDHCVLEQEKEEGGKIRLQREDLFADNILQFLDKGYTITQIGLTWNEQISFTLHNDFSIKQVKFQSVVREQADEYETEDKKAQFDVDFVIMSETLAEFFTEIKSAFDVHQLNTPVTKNLNNVDTVV